MSVHPWTEWKGGTCPVPAETLLEIRTVDGESGFVTAGMCSLFPDWWSDRDGARFITAYRVIEQEGASHEAG